jgi:hypothetical protein
MLNLSVIRGIYSRSLVSSITLLRACAFVTSMQVIGEEHCNQIKLKGDPL